MAIHPDLAHRLVDLNTGLELRWRQLDQRHHPVLHERSIAVVFAEEQSPYSTPRSSYSVTTILAN
jgi:hypothetical protein